MLRRRLAAAALAALTAALLILSGVAGAQTGDQALVRVAHFAPGLLEAAAAGFVVQQRRSTG